MGDSTTATLRERQKSLTRDAIIDALAETIQEQGLHAFSVQDVADRAGVSHRTVYRHFPSREALLDGLAREMDELFRERDLQVLPESAEDIAVQVRTAFELFRERPTLMRSVAVGALATGTQPESRGERDRVFREKVEEAARGLGKAEARKASAVIRYLANSLAWVVLTDQLGLAEDEVGDAVAWAVETLVADLKRRSSEGIETLTGTRDEEEP
jgi:AcrR family transcriptional regulator